MDELGALAVLPLGEDDEEGEGAQEGGGVCLPFPAASGRPRR